MRRPALFTFFLLITSCSSAQSVKMSEPYRATRMEEYVAHCALWRTDAGFRSTIQLSNQLEVAEIDAIPTIYMADGTAWELPPVHLAKSGVQTLDVNDALANAPDRVRAHLSTFGSAAVRYKYDWQGAVYATMTILDVARSLDYLVPFVFLPEQGAGEKIPAEVREFRDSLNARTYEGLWFRNSPTAGGWLALSNSGNATLQVQVWLSGLRTPVQQTYALARHTTSLIDLGNLLGADDARTGGMTVVQSGPPRRVTGGRWFGRSEHRLLHQYASHAAKDQGGVGWRAAIRVRWHYGERARPLARVSLGAGVLALCLLP